MLFNGGHALIIGVGTYQDQGVRNVPITVEDARQVAAVVRDPRYCGYPENQVTLLHDVSATRDNLLQALDKLASVTQDDTVFIFYSGHGMYGQDGYYLTSHDTKLEDNSIVSGTGLHERELLEKIQAIRANRILLIFNACHSGEISPESLGNEEELSKNFPEQTATALLATGEGRIIITACRDKQKSYFLRDAEMTIFAQSLTDGLRGQGIDSKQGYISVFDLYNYIFNSVSTEVERLWGSYKVKQEPELTIHKGIGAMAVALHEGKSPAEKFDTQERPTFLGKTAVREVEPAISERLLNQILNGEINLAAGGDIKNTNIVRGDQHNKDVTLNSGDYAEGNIDKRKGVFGGTFSAPVVGSVEGGSVSIGVSSANTTKFVSLQYILEQVKYIIKAQEQGNDSFRNELEDVARNLEAAIKAEKENDAPRKLKYLKRAKEDIRDIAAKSPSFGEVNLEELSRMLEQVQ